MKIRFLTAVVYSVNVLAVEIASTQINRWNFESLENFKVAVPYVTKRLQKYERRWVQSMQSALVRCKLAAYFVATANSRVTGPSICGSGCDLLSSYLLFTTMRCLTSLLPSGKRSVTNPSVKIGSYEMHY